MSEKLERESVNESSRPVHELEEGVSSDLEAYLSEIVGDARRRLPTAEDWVGVGSNRWSRVSRFTAKQMEREMKREIREAQVQAKPKDRRKKHPMVKKATKRRNLKRVYQRRLEMMERDPWRAYLEYYGPRVFTITREEWDEEIAPVWGPSSRIQRGTSLDGEGVITLDSLYIVDGTGRVVRDPATVRMKKLGYIL